MQRAAAEATRIKGPQKGGGEVSIQWANADSGGHRLYASTIHRAGRRDDNTVGKCRGRRQRLYGSRVHKGGGEATMQWVHADGGKGTGRLNLRAITRSSGITAKDASNNERNMIKQNNNIT